MDLRDLAQAAVLCVYAAIVVWSARDSERRLWVLLFSGICLYVLGSANGVSIEQERAVERARQSAILTSPGMPR